ncbi:50S ribosomal protein L3 [Helicobacter saguini]|uniref:50S ribosomal protein L3 n=1 Tax=Helicobacter saguini TaxID=1548018 RepID=A0A347VQJ0_9HELI|nr:50S ribosomal protein L3 [Helicobacter saguini]MWV60926.1 50S ribosomal protein L3 [Helicobacter saguini]MWV68406.1 50S ribosomal protein L3 [Helicobacter saguini]MWV70130.1 50S ribosomal protein L3 [Helicobacter saguini]MWV72033.1 50S ribosomal protein L3 [Helicobacter saguini]TLD93743.1 50S ribosomal protein L3 [Helicobacter saguini]
MEFIVQKVGMSRIITTPSMAVTLLKVINTKVCAILGEAKNSNGKALHIKSSDGKSNTPANIALVAYPKGKSTNKAIAGNQKKYNLSKEFNKFATLNVANTESGDIDTSLLESNRIIKSSFKTKGRGFSGAIKRWNFQGGPAAHGSRFHRRLGSIGNREWPGRVQPGKKMAGHYGDELVSVESKILSFDKNTGILVVKGSIPGYNGAFGKIKILNKTKK